MNLKLHFAVAMALTACTLSAQVPEYGPEKGTLVIQGGGSAEGTGIMETFVNKAGGPGAKIVVVPTAGGNRAAVSLEEVPLARRSRAITWCGARLPDQRL